MKSKNTLQTTEAQDPQLRLFGMTFWDILSETRNCESNTNKKILATYQTTETHQVLLEFYAAVTTHGSISQKSFRCDREHVLFVFTVWN